MAEEHNQKEELWEDVPEPEEITEEEARKLPIELPGLPPIADEPESDQPKRPPDKYLKLQGAPFGHAFPHDPDLRVPVYFEQNDIKTIGHSKYWMQQLGEKRSVRWYVRINSQRLRERGATQRGIELVLKHEAQGHCRGYGHHEANAQVNPAFSPTVNIWA